MTWLTDLGFTDPFWMKTLEGPFGDTLRYHDARIRFMKKMSDPYYPLWVLVWNTGSMRLLSLYDRICKQIEKMKRKKMIVITQDQKLEIIWPRGTIHNLKVGGE